MILLSRSFIFASKSRRRCNYNAVTDMGDPACGNPARALDARARSPRARSQRVCLIDHEFPVQWSLLAIAYIHCL